MKTKDLNTILECEHQRYTDPAVLSEGVKKGTILLVKADYFEERYDAKQPIQCYQDIRDTEGVDYFVQELEPESLQELEPEPLQGQEPELLQEVLQGQDSESLQEVLQGQESEPEQPQV